MSINPYRQESSQDQFVVRINLWKFRIAHVSFCVFNYVLLFFLGHAHHVLPHHGRVRHFQPQDAHSIYHNLCWLHLIECYLLPFFFTITFPWSTQPVHPGDKQCLNTYAYPRCGLTSDCWCFSTQIPYMDGCKCKH